MLIGVSHNKALFPPYLGVLAHRIIANVYSERRERNTREGQ